VQLTFGMPFQAHQSAFERPIPAIPVVLPARQPPQPTGPVRRGVRNFLGSMYSLMFHSRMENPSQAESSAPVLTALPVEAAPPFVEPAVPRSMSVWPRHYAPRRRIRPWVVGAVGLFIIVLGWVGMFARVHQEAAIEMMAARNPTSVRGLSILEDRYRDFKTRWQLFSDQSNKDAENLFRRTEEEYLALEARFTKRERSGGSRVTTTI